MIVASALVLIMTPGSCVTLFRSTATRVFNNVIMKYSFSLFVFLPFHPHYYWYRLGILLWWYGKWQHVITIAHIVRPNIDDCSILIPSSHYWWSTQVRAKNVLTTVLQSYAAIGIITVLWWVVQEKRLDGNRIPFCQRKTKKALHVTDPVLLPPCSLSWSRYLPGYFSCKYHSPSILSCVVLSHQSMQPHVCAIFLPTAFLFALVILQVDSSGHPLRTSYSVMSAKVKTRPSPQAFPSFYFQFSSWNLPSLLLLWSLVLSLNVSTSNHGASSCACGLSLCMLLLLTWPGILKVYFAFGVSLTLLVEQLSTVSACLSLVLVCLSSIHFLTKTSLPPFPPSSLQCHPVCLLLLVPSS